MFSIHTEHWEVEDTLYTRLLFISAQDMWMLHLKLKKHLYLGMIKLEVRRILGEENLKEYVKDMWKVMDLGTACLYVIVIILRLLAYFEVSSYLIDVSQWNP